MKPFKFLRPEPLYWRTAMGERKLVSEMTGEHIYNVIGVLKGNLIPNPYLGRTNDEWIDIFEQELRNRHIR